MPLCCARAVLAHPTSHATAVLELRPRVPMFLPLCKRPCSSASRCPQGSMEPYAWPNTQQYQSSPSDGQPLQSHTSRAKLHKPCSRNRCQGQRCCCCCRQGRRHRRRPLLPKSSLHHGSETFHTEVIMTFFAVQNKPSNTLRAAATDARSDGCKNRTSTRGSLSTKAPK